VEDRGQHRRRLGLSGLGIDQVAPGVVHGLSQEFANRPIERGLRSRVELGQEEREDVLHE
jgi:hypothetical protein